MIEAFEQAKNGIRMEEPCRILTRFALDFATHLFTKDCPPITQKKVDFSTSSIIRQMENIRVKSDTSSSLLNQSIKNVEMKKEPVKKRQYKKTEEIKAPKKDASNSQARIQTDLSYSS
jgi:hypothetical protein